MKIIECVPNFSEGRDRKKIAAIAHVFKSFSGVRLADFSSDADHNRSVFTFLGKPEDVLEAALAASGKALELIDMRQQHGVQISRRHVLGRPGRQRRYATRIRFMEQGGDFLFQGLQCGRCASLR